VGRLDVKAHKAKDEEDIIQEIEEWVINEDDHFPRATHLARKLVDKGLNLSSTIIKVSKYHSFSR
jgi:hypothetical protein